MELVPQNELNFPNNKLFYLPHHAVLKESSITTKLRVVFNGSSKSSSGKSLNDLLALGPIIQDDLFSLLCRFRSYPIVLTADIEKMYRQVAIEPRDRNFLRILWRYSLDEPISTYRLTTVTYGTKPASFLAIRALQQVVYDNQLIYPLASKCILNDFYVDNLLTGCFSIEDAKKLQSEVFKIALSGGFPLRQWCSNKSELLEHLSKNLLDNVSFSENSDDSVRTLGMNWLPNSDTLTFKQNLLENDKTKRVVLSNISRIFDPLGLISPIIIKSKIFMQNLWLHKLEWDQLLPEELLKIWHSLKNDFVNVSKVSIPRYVSIQKPKNYVLHIFSDASKAAYASVAYICTTGELNTKSCHLLCSKTKVAPLKLITIPRLELCGAVLSVTLCKKIIKSLTVKIDHIYFWCDSQIVLYWVSSPARNWKIFISNRVSLIHELLDSFPHSWHYVPSGENPADISSRGSTVEQLVLNKLWWFGPKWLHDCPSSWPRFNKSSKINDNLLEFKNECAQVSLVSVKICDYLPDKFSSFLKLLRVIVYCFRFYKKIKGISSGSYISADEYKRSLIYVVHLHQLKHFSSEINSLKKGLILSNKSSLLSLNPFLDDDGLIRVGGRIKNSLLKENHRHPLILAKTDNLTNLIIDYNHLRYHHAGCQLLKAILSREFWILSGASVIKFRIYKCMICVRLRSSTLTQIMGNLPSNRLIPSRPFNKCGVDYAGPILTKRYKGRCKSIEKSYIALFVCFTTKAIHLELVSDLSVESFLASLRRFISRRGRPADIYSDNGTNFVGAKNVLESLRKYVQTNEYKQKIGNWMSSEFINWHNIPAYAPHMGGLWEAGIKSVKTHLKTLTVNIKYTFEELYTLLTEIEACLNSRPLSELSSDPNDLECLTPGHFLIGAPLSALPERNILDEKLNFNKRWDLIKRVNQHFWKRWSLEYVSRLQTRFKWKKVSENLKIGDMVIIKNEFSSPLKWPLGRVITLHTGKDNCVRVVTVKTKTGVLTRSINLLVPLPFIVDNDQPGGVC